MRCARVRRRLSAYQDGELAAPERKAVQAHLAECRDCSALATELQQAWGLLDLTQTIGPPPGLVAGVLRRVQATPPRRAWQAPRWAVVAGLIVCLVCGGMAGYVHSLAPGAVPAARVALATDVAQQMGLEAFAPAPTDTIAGAYVQFTGATSPQREVR